MVYYLGPIFGIGNDICIQDNSYEKIKKNMDIMS